MLHVNRLVGFFHYFSWEQHLFSGVGGAERGLGIMLQFFVLFRGLFTHIRLNQSDCELRRSVHLSKFKNLNSDQIFTPLPHQNSGYASGFLSDRLAFLAPVFFVLNGYNTACESVIYPRPDKTAQNCLLFTNMKKRSKIFDFLFCFFFDFSKGPPFVFPIFSNLVFCIKTTE